MKLPCIYNNSYLFLTAANFVCSASKISFQSRLCYTISCVSVRTHRRHGGDAHLQIVRAESFVIFRPSGQTRHTYVVTLIHFNKLTDTRNKRTKDFVEI